jgi:hypothetical protein
MVYAEYATFCNGVVDDATQQAPEMDEESNVKGEEGAPKKKLPKEMRWHRVVWITRIATTLNILRRRQ